MEIKTVKLKCDNQFGYRFINEEDFDSEVDELFDVEPEIKRPTAKQNKKVEFDKLEG